MTSGTVASYESLTAADELTSYPEIIAAYLRVCLAISQAGPAAVDEFAALVGGTLCDLLHLRRHAVYLRGDDGNFHAEVYERKDGLDLPLGHQIVPADDPMHHEVIRKARPLFISDARSDPRVHPWTVERWGLRSMLYVPMLLGDQVVGLIHLDAAHVRAELSESALKTAEAFAGLCALAVHHTRLADRLGHRAFIIENQRALLAQLAEIHDKLNRAVLEGSDVRGTLTQLSRFLDSPTMLYSSDLRLLVGVHPDSSSLRCDAVPDAATLSVKIQDSTWGQSPLVFNAGGFAGCLLAPIVVDSTLMGYLAVLEDAQPLTSLTIRAAEQASTTIALQLLIEQKQADALGQAKEDFLADLLYGERDPDQLDRRAMIFNVDLKAPHVLCHIGRPGVRSTPQELRWLLDRLLSAHNPVTPLQLAVPGGHVILLPVISSRDGLDRQIFRRLIDELPEAGWSTPVCVSEVCRRAEDYALAFADLRALADFGRRFGLTRLLTTVDTSVLRLVVTGGGPSEAARFARRVLRPLESTDPSLITTLRAYLDNGAKIRTTARELKIHENSVRYRLKRIRQLLNVDPESLDGMLQIRLALQVIETSG